MKPLGDMHHPAYWNSMQPIAVARHAMNTRFEVLLYGGDVPALRAAAEAALDEVARLESQISPFRPDSEISRANREAARQPVRVSANVFALLERAQTLAQESGGLFDPTVGPLLDGWRTADRLGRNLNTDELQRALEKVGMDKVELRKGNHTVRFAAAGMALDMGAIGKGWAIDCAVEVLRENGVRAAFLHGGTSSAHGFGKSPDALPWKVAVTDPRQAQRTSEAQGEFLTSIILQDESLGISAARARDNPIRHHRPAHVLDPRTGDPASDTLLAAVITGSATDADALSTALLVGGRGCIEKLAARRPDSFFLLATEPPDHARPVLLTRGHDRAGQGPTQG